MKRLFILCHAKSSWKDPDLSDHDRPLNKRGKQDAPLMGKVLKDEDISQILLSAHLQSELKRQQNL
jgi:phosphohistidine phosphatase